MNKNKPIYEERLGHIRLTVWENTNERGTFYNVNVVRRYRDTDGEYRDTHTFTGLADLALVAEAARLARDFVTRAQCVHTDEVTDQVDF